MKLIHYLTATGIDNGLLINFGDTVQIKRKFREYKPKRLMLNMNLASPCYCCYVLPRNSRNAQKSSIPPPQFTDPQRKQKLAAALPEIDKLFNVVHGALASTRRGAGRHR